MRSVFLTAFALLFGTSVLVSSVAAEEIVVGGYGALLVGGPAAVALERGEFKKRGVDITAVQGSLGGGTTLRNMFGGNLPYAVSSAPAAIAAFKEGIDVIIVNSSIDTHEDLLWVTLPNSSVKTIKDLVGKRLSYTSPRSSSEAISSLALEAAGIPLSAVNRLALGGIGAGLAALENGGTDAALINEPLWSARQGRYRVVFDLSNMPRMTQSVGITTHEIAQKYPQKVRAIVEAFRAAVDFIYANPEEAARIISKQYGDTLPVDVATRAVKRMVQIRYWSSGRIDMAGLENLAKGLERVGALSGPVDWNKLVDRSFLPEDLRK